MKKIAVWLLFCFACAALPALDPGGVSLDLMRFEVAAEKSTGENLLANGSFEDKNLNLNHGKNLGTWGGNCNVHAGQASGVTQELRDKFKAVTTRSRMNANPADGSWCVALISPPEVRDLRDATGSIPQFSNRISQRIDIKPPAAEPVKFRLAFKLRGKLGGLSRPNEFNSFLQLHGTDGKATAKTKQTRHTLNADWTEYTVDVVAPAGTARLIVALALYGSGEAYLDDVRLTRENIAGGIVARAWPYSFGDKTFVLGEGTPSTLLFCCKNEAGIPPKKLRLMLKVPAGVNVLGAAAQAPIISAENNVAALDVQRLYKTFARDSFYTWNAASVLLQPEVKAGAALEPLEYWLEDGDWRGPVETLQLQVIPAVKGVQPKRFRSAPMIAREFNFTEPEALAGITRLVKDSGFNSVHGGSLPLARQFKQAGIERYAQTFFICNGYRIGQAPKPPEAQFKFMDGTAWTTPHEMICPVEVYQNGPYYREHVVKGILKKVLADDDQADQIMPNWEPYMFDFKGCFCPRCKDEFVRYAGGRLDAAAMEAAWPRGILESFKDEWVKFRSWQHGRVVAQLEKDTNTTGKLAGKNSHFIPEIAWSAFTEAEARHFAQYQVKDYIADLPWLSPWGPYIFHDFTKPYEYFPGLHLVTYVGGTAVRQFADNLDRDKNLIAMPQGMQCNTWLTEPEALAFEFQCFFINRFQGAFAYYFPRGYDYRHWRALAIVNTRIAAVEDMVLDGKPAAATVEPVTPLPAPFFPVLWSVGSVAERIPALKEAKMLESRAFEHQGKTLIAAGNFWQKGEVFFTVKVPGLAAGKRYCAALNGQPLGEFSGVELQNGILAHAGALRWSFITIEPAGKPVENPLTQAQIKALMQERLPAINKAMEWEKQHRVKYERNLASETPDSGLDKIRNLKAGPVTLENQNDLLLVKTPKYQIQIDPAHGGRLTDWRSGSTALIADDPVHGMAVDAFLLPPRTGQITAGYKVTGARADGGALEVSLARTLTNRDSVPLAGLELAKTFRFTADAVEVKTQITNPSAELAVDFAFRYHNLPALLNLKGTADFGGGTVFKRDMLVKMAHFAEPDAEIDKGALTTLRPFEIKSSAVVFSTPGTSLKLQCELPPSQLYGILFWDAGRAACSTFEPVFKKVTLAPNGKIAYSMKWTVK